MKYTLVTTKVYLKIRKIKALICKGVRVGGVCVWKYWMPQERKMPRIS